MTTPRDASGRRFYLGTKADLKPGDLVEAGGTLTSSFDAAAWHAESAEGDGAGRIYTVEPTGPVEPDIEAGDRLPVAATSYRTPASLRVIAACTDAMGRPLRFYHGTKADLRPGDLIEPGRSPNFGDLERTTNYVYLAGTMDAAVWGAELALGEGQGRVYLVEPTGAIEDDPNLTNTKFRGNPTKSYRSSLPLRVVGEVTDWQGHPPEVLKAMQDGLEELKRRGVEPIDE